MMTVAKSLESNLFDPGQALALLETTKAEAIDGLFEKASAYFALLSEASRLRILQTICYQERSVQEVVAQTGLPQPNVSRHLSLLHRSGVLSRRRVGTSVFYKVSDQTLTDLCRLVCARMTAPEAS